MAASTLYFLSLVFIQFVNIKKQICSSICFKIQNFHCISSCGTEWNFLFNKRGKNVLGTRILCCPCFFFNINITCIQVCPFPRRKRRDPEFCPFGGQAWWEEFAAAAWENCYGKSAGQLCPSNQPPDQFVAGHLMGQFRSPSILLACSGIPLWSSFPLQHRPLLRGGVNAAYPLCGACSVLSRRCRHEALSCKWWVRAEDRLPWGQRAGHAASSSSPPAPSSVALLAGPRLTTQTGQCWHTLSSVLLGSSNWGEGRGIVSSQRSRFSGKCSPYLPLSSSSPSNTWLLRSGHKTPWTTPN